MGADSEDNIGNNKDKEEIEYRRSEGAVDSGYMSDLLPIQAVSLAIQDQVNTIQNLSTISNTAIGSAYSKWLNNPFNSEYQTIIDNIIKTNKNGRWEDLRNAVAVVKDLKSAQQFDGIETDNQSSENNTDN